MPRTLLATLLLATPLAYAASAEQTFVDNLASQALLPRYTALAQHSQQLADSLDRLCQAPSAANLANAREQWRQSYRRWMAVAPLNWGPTAELRSQRLIAFKPTRIALIEQAVSENLGRSKDSYDEAGAAAKGFSAIEYQLFTRQQDLTDATRCAWLQQNGQEIATHTPVLAQAWQDFAANVGRSGQAGALYANAAQPLEEIVNLTLAGVNEMHKELSRLPQQKPELVNAQRSGEGKALLKAQFSLLQTVLTGSDGQHGIAGLLAAKGQPAQTKALQDASRSVAAALEKLPENLAQNGHSGREKPAVQALEKLLGQIEGPLAHTLDITLSFNETDGD
jgi:hypothetical protein